jgi:hypothetical protein
MTTIFANGFRIPRPVLSDIFTNKLWMLNLYGKYRQQTISHSNSKNKQLIYNRKCHPNELQPLLSDIYARLFVETAQQSG